MKLQIQYQKANRFKIFPIRFYLTVELLTIFTHICSFRSKLPFLRHFFAQESDIKVCGAPKHEWEENH